MDIPQGVFDYVRDYLESYASKSLKERMPCHPGVKETPHEEDIDRIMDGVRERIEELKLIEKYGWWAAHPEFPREDWVHSVQKNDTSTGYWQWVAKQHTEEGE